MNWLDILGANNVTIINEPQFEEVTYMTDETTAGPRKRYNLSLPPEAAAELERRAAAANLPPTTLAARILADVLELRLRPVGKPKGSVKE
jgi:hypothetical protein